MSKKSCDFPRELLVALFSLLCTCSWAGPRSYSQAKAIAEKKAVEMGLQVLDGSSQENLAKGMSGVVEKQSPYYVFSNAEAKGFVIVSGDDRFPEIVGYSDQGTYDEAQLPDNSPQPKHPAVQDAESARRQRGVFAFYFRSNRTTTSRYQR